MIWDILEEETGARLTHSFGRIGGMAQPPTRRASRRWCATALPRDARRSSTRARSCSCKNRIFLDRLRGRRQDLAGRRARARLDGPVPALDRRRLRRAQGAPVPGLRPTSTSTCRSGTNGDNYDRFMCRLEEIRQSARIIEQALEQMPDEGPVNVDDPRVMLPAEGGGLHDDRRHDPALQDRDGRHQGARGRGLLVHRRRQRRARLLPRLRRQRHALPRAHPPAVLRDRRRASASSITGAHDRRTSSRRSARST